MKTRSNGNEFSYHQTFKIFSLSLLTIAVLITLSAQGMAQVERTGSSPVPIQPNASGSIPSYSLDTVFLYGPILPPPLGMTFSQSGTPGDSQIGHGTGKNWYFSNVGLANQTTTYWGFVNDSVLLSFNGNTFTEPPTTTYSEVMTYRADLSDLPGGIVVWSGETRLPTSAAPVYTRFVLTIKEQVGDTALPLVDASSLGLPTDAGGILLVGSGLAYKANLLVFASYSSTTGFIPSLDFYDAETTAELTAYTSLTDGFYWENVAPVLNTIGSPGTTENVQLLFNVSGTDLEDNSPRFSTSTLPSGAQFNDNLDGKGTFSWTPTFLQSGNHPVTFYTTDTLGAKDSEIVTITVIDAGNQLPILNPIGGRFTNEGAQLNFNVFGADTESIPALTTSLPLPTGATFTDSGNGTGNFNWTPDFLQGGTTYDVTFYATDDSGAVDFEVVTITVNEGGNLPPVLAGIGPKGVTEGALLQFTVSATDVESTPALTTTLPLPTGASFADSGNGTGLFSWTPGFLQSGSYPVTFYATDDSLAVDSEIVTITITDAGNQLPVLAGIGPISDTEGVQLLFTVSATDAESIPQLTTSLPLPAGASFADSGNGTGTFDWTPDFNQAGSYDVTFYATDDSSAVDSVRITITIIDGGNQNPFLTKNNPLTVDEGATATITNGLLAADDAESPPSDINFIVGPDSNPPPRNGDLKLLGVVLGSGDSFTQQDLDSGRVTYTHDGSETTSDGFTFRVMDADGGIASDLGHTVFGFSININLLNDPPVVYDTSYTTGVGLNLNGRVTGSDEESPNLQFFITKNGRLGLATILNADSGTFLYTPFPDSTGIDSLEFKAFDGLIFSPAGNLVISITNIPPTAIDDSGATSENVVLVDTLKATDPDIGASLVYRIETNGSKGSAVVTDSTTGQFSYTPNLNAIGPDTFTFVAFDGSDLSSPATFIVSIKPNLDAGDLLIAENTKAVVLVDPATAQQALLSSGGILSTPNTVTLDNDGNIVIMDSDSGLIRIDALTGVQTIVSPRDRFSTGPAGPLGLAVESSGDILVANGVLGLMRVDPITGDTSTVSSGGSLLLAAGIVLDNAGDVILSSAGAFTGDTSRILRIDPISGAQTVISSAGQLLVPMDITLDANGDILVVDASTLAGAAQDVIVRVDTATGTQTVISSGGIFKFTSGIELSDAGEIYVVSSDDSTIISVDSATGTQSVLTFAGYLSRPWGITIVPTPCCQGIRGDYDGDGADGDVIDLTFIIDDIFRGGPSSACDEEADIDGNGEPSTVVDMSFLIDYIFRGGTSPPSCP